MTNRKIRWDFWTIVIVAVVTLLAPFLLYPLVSLFLSGFKDTETGVRTINNYARFFSERYYKSTLLSSFKLTFYVTVVAIVLGMPLAYFMSSCKMKGKGVPEVLFIISMMSPNLTGACSWILLLGRSGTVIQFLKSLGIHMPPIYGFGGILLVFVLELYPFIYMHVSGAPKKIDVALSEAAESSGCDGFKKVFTIIISLATPALTAAALPVFVDCMIDFGTSASIDKGYRIMSTLVYSEFVGETGGSANFAACMATIMAVVTVTAFLLWRWYVDIRSFIMSSMRLIQSKEVHGIRGFFIHLFIYLPAAISIIPQCIIVYTSSRATKVQVFVDGFSLEDYRKVFPTAVRSIKNTYLYCLVAVVITMVLGTLIVYLVVKRKSWFTNIIDTIAMFPYIVPGSVLDITLLIAFNHPPMMLADSVITMVISPVIRRQAYTLRSSSVILYQINPSTKEVAISLGGSPSMSFVKAAAKMMLPDVASSTILSWIIPINELSSSVILYVVDIKTMSVAIYNRVIRTSYGTTTVLATILTITTVVSLLVFFKVSDNRDATM